MVMQKVLAALKPGGRFAFVMKLGKGEEVSDDKLGVPRFFCYWQTEEIEQLVYDSGFETCQTTYQADYRKVNPRAGSVLVSALKGQA
jgi:hypothetical protein